MRFVKPPKKANYRTLKGASGQAENRPGECYRCGGKTHLAKDCRFKNADCNHCGRKGHIARVRRSRNFASSTKLIRVRQTPQTAGPKLSTSASSVKSIDGSVSDCNTLVTEASPSVTVQLEVYGKSVEF